MRTEGYLVSSQAYLSHRLKYYSDTRIIPPKLSVNLDQFLAVERLRTLKPEIIIVTATNDRLDKLKDAHKILIDQKGTINWAWLIVDNLSSDGTIKHFNQTKDDRVIVADCESKEKCAYPVRNHALGIISTAFWGNHGAEPWITIVDSDDRLHDNYSLHELMRMTKSFYGRRRGIALVHGYSDTRIHYANNNIKYVPNPRDVSSSFPKVENLAETFYKGLNILAGAFPVELLSRLRYPKEKSFEDAGFNEKLMLQAIKSGLVWLDNRHPFTIKNFHRDSMSEINNMRGDTAKVDRVGPYVVTGIRADIVSYYRSLMDYFVREEL